MNITFHDLDLSFEIQKQFPNLPKIFSKNAEDLFVN